MRQEATALGVGLERETMEVTVASPQWTGLMVSMEGQDDEVVLHLVADDHVWVEGPDPLDVAEWA